MSEIPPCSHKVIIQNHAWLLATAHKEAREEGPAGPSAGSMQMVWVPQDIYSGTW